MKICFMFWLDDNNERVAATQVKFCTEIDDRVHSLLLQHVWNISNMQKY